MRYLLSLLAINLKAAFALRTAFWMQVVFMLLNNLLLFVFWWVIFERFDQIRGWRLPDVATLFGISAAGYGVAAILAGGVPDLARRIHDGELDPMLTLPRSVLLQAVAARTRPDGWGDIVSGLVLVGLAGYLDLAHLPLVLLAILVSAFMFTASGVLVQCAAFWLGKVDALARQITDFIVTFCTYPPVLFGWKLKVLLFTLLPAGFISYLPVALVRDFDASTLALALAGAAIYGALARWVFGRGLRHYASGSRFGVRS